VREGVLLEKGFAVVPGPFGPGELTGVLSDVDRAIDQCPSGDVYTGSTGTNVRMEGLLDRAPSLAAVFTHPLLLKVASKKIGGPFRLSSFHLRTVLPGAEAQVLHQDVAPGEDGWPLIGFMFMVDEFSAQNGATRFVSGTESLASMPEILKRAHPDEERACGGPGSMVIFDGSVWHGFGANRSANSRRGVYGALIPQRAKPARDFSATLPPMIWDQLSAESRELLSAA
jgi:ectoine hydroxylase-related dioxygenase (phytanoyl-CoA dioxygenase family)